MPGQYSRRLGHPTWAEIPIYPIPNSFTNKFIIKISSFCRMIRLKTHFKDVSADVLYDVLHDPVYRKVS
jgi:hypothetical protein